MNKSKMQAGDRVIGNGEPCFVIAEAGVNHNGDLELAKRLIEAAARAGADAIKFQTFKTDLLLTPNTPKADYQLVGTCHNESQFDMLNRLELSQDAHWILRDLAVKLGLVFLSTPFDEKSADFLEELGVPLFKMSSGELTNHPLLQWVAKKGRPMIVSTGMANLEEIKDALKVIENNGCHAVSILHCTSSYPTLPIDCNLRAMKQLNDTFGMTIGYSDHTLGTEVALAAVAMNARILEKHLTLDRKMLGPDHQMSLEPK